MIEPKKRDTEADENRGNGRPWPHLNEADDYQAPIPWENEDDLQDYADIHAIPSYVLGLDEY